MALPKVNKKKNEGILKSVLNTVGDIGGGVADALKGAALNELGGDFGKTLSLTKSLVGTAKNLLAPTTPKVDVDKAKNKKDKNGKPENKNKKPKATTPKAPSSPKSDPVIGKMLATQSGLLVSIRDTLREQAPKLDVLDAINVEMRTLTSITAKVWDVSKKQLSDTRAYQKKVLEGQRKQKFKAQIDSTDNNTLSEVFASLNKNRPTPGVAGAGILSAKPTGGSLMDDIVQVAPELAQTAGVFGLGKAAIKALLGGGKAKAAKAAAGVANKVVSGGKSVMGFAKNAAKSGGRVLAGGAMNLAKIPGMAAGAGALYSAGSGVFGAADELLQEVPLEKYKSIGKDVGQAWDKSDGVTSGLWNAAKALVTNDDAQDITMQVGKRFGKDVTSAVKDMTTGALGLIGKMGDWGKATEDGVKAAGEATVKGIEDVFTRFQLMQAGIQPAPKPAIAPKMSENKARADSTPIPAVVQNPAQEKSNNTIIDSSKRSSTTINNFNQTKDRKWEAAPVVI